MINDYKEVRECVYKDEHYSVRDNGAIFRHRREGRKMRSDDDKWTFGMKNSKTGYMLIGQHRVHIIVATAFLGARDSKVYVVDHIDTNRCNNRVENLRWFTRLENALNNEITRSKIIYICGSIEAFIENPNILRERLDQVKEPSLEWMRTVTKEEATMAYENINQYWEEQAKNPKPLTGGKLNENIFKRPTFNSAIQPEVASNESAPCQEGVLVGALTVEQVDDTMSLVQTQSNVSRKSDICDWSNAQVFLSEKKYIRIDGNDGEPSGLVKAQSPDTAWQKNSSRTPVQFVCCPNTIENNPIQEYYNQLVIGKVYSITKLTKNESMVQLLANKAYTRDNSAIIVVSSTDDYLRLTKIYYSDGRFIHEYLQNYKCSQKNQALKHFVSELGYTKEEYETKQKFSVSNLVKAKSPDTAWQMRWKTPTDFLCCPSTIGDNPIEEYYNRIRIGEDYNSTYFYGSNQVQKVVDKARLNDNTIIVLSCNPNSLKPYALSKIHYFESKFIHESLGTFFEEDGGRKYFTLEQGSEWTGEDPIDEYC